VSDEAQLLALLEEAPAAIAIQRGPELRYEMANARYRGLLGGRPLVGRTLAETLPDWAQLRRILEGVYRDGTPFVAREYRFLIDPDGNGELRDAWFDIICQPLHPANAKLGVLSFGVDVTAQVEARHRLEATASELRRAVDARDEFLSVASHELKTPLTALRLQVQSLQRSVVRGPPAQFSPAQMGAKLDAAGRQVERLVELIDTLLDVSRLQSGTLDLAVADVDLLALVRDVLDRNRTPAGAAGSMIALECAEGEPIIGQWDRSRVDQVLTNLVSNAIKYGGGKPIVVRVAVDQSRAHITVIDQGLGIAPEDQARIFHRFERAVSRTHFAGLGLGLWISRRIAETLGGSISVESALGQGARFTFALPL
jgi:signal transduction histidine kinase